MPTYSVRYERGPEAFEQQAELSDDVTARAFGQVLIKHFAQPHRGRQHFAGWLLTVIDSFDRPIMRATIWPDAATPAKLH